MRKSAAILATAVLGATLAIGSATTSMARNGHDASTAEHASQAGVSVNGQTSSRADSKSGLNGFVGRDQGGVQDYWHILRMSPLHQPW
jgi:uncharacterized membrane protein